MTHLLENLRTNAAPVNDDVERTLASLDQAVAAFTRAR